MDIPGCTWYPAILSIAGLTYTCRIAWISQDVVTWYPRILSIEGLTYTGRVAWISQDVLGIPGYLVLRD